MTHNRLIRRRQVSRVERPRTVDGDSVDGAEGRMGEVQVQASVQDQSEGSPPGIRAETDTAMCKKKNSPDHLEKMTSWSAPPQTTSHWITPPQFHTMQMKPPHSCVQPYLLITALLRSSRE